jgi:hypothetical protein
MDPNSRRSQFSPFNARQTRTGPMSPTTRNNEPPIPKPSLPLDPKAARRPSTSRESSGSSMESLKSIRKIATNSKIRDREYRRNQLQLVFVNDALQQRLNVREFAPSCRTTLNPPYIGTNRGFRRAGRAVQSESGLSTRLCVPSLMAHLALPCHLSAGTATFTPRTGHHRHEMDHNGQHICEGIYRLHWNAY